MTNYLYINYAKVGEMYLSKVGISNNPEKRINEFNIGVKHRTSFVDSPVFKRFFTVKIPDRGTLVIIERLILQLHRDIVNPFYGREVLKIHPERLSIKVNNLVGEFYHA